MALLFLAATGVRADEKDAASSPRQETGFPVATPESQGMSEKALDSLAAVVRHSFEKDQIVGAELLVIKNRRTVLHEVVGWRDRENKTLMTHNTIFNIRSMTKPLTGAAIQILIDRGDLKLSDRASKYIPGFDNAKSNGITIEQLLAHRSGLPLSAFTIGPRQFKDLQAIANTVGEKGPQFPPSSKFWYSDAGSDVLGAIVEKTSGKTLDEFWHRNLLDPLAMHDTFCAIDRIDKQSEPRWGRLASLYMAGQSQNKGWFPFWKPTGKPLYPFAWGSQTLYSTPADYARFLAMWMDDGMVKDKRILSAAAIARTLTPVSNMKSLGSDRPYPTGFPGFDTFYGQMSVLYKKSDAPQEAKPVVIGHSGSDGTWAWAWPEQDLMVFYFTQSRGQRTGIGLEFRINRLLIQPKAPKTELRVTAENDPSLSRVIGEWEGKIEIGKTRAQQILWRFEISDSGELVGFMGPANRGVAWIPMQNLVLTDSEISFDVKSQKGKYKGLLTEDKVSGTWSQRGGSRPMKMTKINFDRQVGEE